MCSLETRQGHRGLDKAARDRRAKKALEALEQDNFQDDPVDDYESLSKKGPKLDSLPSGKRKNHRTADYYKNKYIKSFQHLLEESEAHNPNGPNYASAQAPCSGLPKRNFCSVCGFFATYTCVQCGSRYCQPKCLSTHVDTRCLKWTA